LKLILSRKGFDSSNGGFPSLILPDGRMVSLPIPEKSKIRYSDLLIEIDLNKKSKSTYKDFMEDLFRDKIKSEKRCQSIEREDQFCHLDPDIYKNIIQRKLGWRGAFGQIDQAATHLENQKVQEGDIFLFFGWFRKTKLEDNKLIYDKIDEQGRHIIFGYMEIGEIIKPSLATSYYDWLEGHPHLEEKYLGQKQKTHTLYLAADYLSLAPGLPGYGTFNFSEKLVLSKEGETKSKWNLPDIFRKTKISYHSNAWKEDYFQSVGRGQEFVMEATEEIKGWALSLITQNLT